jgi:hypothetical protein
MKGMRMQRFREIRDRIRAAGRRARHAVRMSTPWRRWWHELTRQDRKAVRRYILGSLWAVAFVVFTPTAIADALDSTLRYAVIAGGILGGVAAAYGRATFQHLSWELRGVFAMVSALTFYAGVQIALVLTVGLPTGNTDRVALSVLSIWIVLEVEDRLEYLVRRFIERIRTGFGSDRTEDER